MTEMMDKLIIRIFLTLVICALLFLYKSIHSLIYPSSHQQIFKTFFPSKNSPDSMHFFSRIIGVGIIFSSTYFYLQDGMIFALLDFSLMAVTSFVIYLLSIYILESIILYNFEYTDEVIKRKNYAYAIVSSFQAIGLAYLLQNVMRVANDSIVLTFFIWLFAIVIMGFSAKTFSLFSNLPFNRLIIQRNLAVSFSFSGFFLGWAIIITSAIDHELTGFRIYIIKVIIKFILSLIIFPIFKKFIVVIFRLREDYVSEGNNQPEIGYGIYEGVVFLTACLLTSIITGKINFGSFYPIF